jgi:hypothetical protein
LADSTFLTGLDFFAIGDVVSVFFDLVGLLKKTASISFDPDKASLAALTKATADAGYPSSVHN